MKRFILLLLIIAVVMISCSDDGSSSKITSISEVGMITNGDIALVAVNGEYVYFCGWNNTDNSFSVYDYSNPDNPVKVFNTNVGYAYGICTDGDFVYIETDGSGTAPFDIGSVCVFDCRNPTNIKYVTNNSDGYSSAYQNYYHNGYVYSFSSDIIGVFQTSSSGELTHINNISSSSAEWGYFLGDYMYVVDEDTFRIFDISTPSSPSLIGTNYNSSYYCTGCAVKDNYAFIGGDSKNIVILDISDKSSPVEVKNYSIINGTSSEMYEMKIFENYLLIAGDSDFYVIDISNPIAPVEVDSVATSSAGNGWGFAISGRYALVADDTICRIIQLY